MKRKTIGIGIGVLLGILALVLGGIWYYIQTSAFMDKVEQTASTVASDTLGVPVSVGAIKVNSLHDLEIHDLAVYDKQADCIATADTAKVEFRLLSAYRDPAHAVSEVTLSGVEANLIQRDDGSWNVEDIQTKSSGQGSFFGKVKVEDGGLNLSAQGKELYVGDVSGSLDFADYPVLKLDAKGSCLGAEASLSGTYRKERQIFNAEVTGLDLAEVLPLVPDGTIPDGVEILGGKVKTAKVSGQYMGSVLSFSGQAEYEDGAVKVKDTEVDDIHGFTSFTDTEALIFADAEAAGQQAHVDGKVRYDTDSPYLDINASSDSFDPSKVLKDIPYEGAVAVKAHIMGPVKSPIVEGDVTVASGRAMDIPFTNARAHVRYEDSLVRVQDLSAAAFGGTLSGEGQFSPSDLTYTAHLVGKDIDVQQAAVFVPQLADITGRVNVDMGLSGTGSDVSALQTYGSASLQSGSYKELPIESFSASFLTQGKDVTIDYASLRLPHRTSLGLEGSIKEGNNLDLAFYGGHVDLSLISTLIPEADVTGLGDFEGTVHGDISDPQVSFKFTATNGTLFKQPYDSLKFNAGGNLDGVTIDEFSLVKDGKQTWYVDGSVGLTGERRINMRIDTVGARMEDIAALAFPDQPITGNVDNTIRITGTLDHPNAVGYIHFYYGSYKGILLSGMDGDYFMEDGVTRLQDFHIFSPMVDMDVNGTVDRDMNLDLVANVHEINMERFASKFPYPVSGKGTFAGKISGSLASPQFDGTLDAPSITLNDQEIRDVHGTVNYRDGVVNVNPFGFHQGDGIYEAALSIDTNTHDASGTVKVTDGDVNALTAIANLKNDIVSGKLSSDIEIGGTYDNPEVTLNGILDNGKISGYDVHDVEVNLHLLDKIIYIEKLSGMQGTDGSFSASGSVGIDGPIAAKFSAHNLALGLFTKSAGLERTVHGTADIEAEFGGTTGNPSANVTIAANNGGFQGSTFDALNGEFKLTNGLVDVKEFAVKKTINGKDYQATAKGIVPLKALFANSNEDLDDYERIKLDVNLDQADLSILPFVSDQVDWALGPTKGTLEFTGTLAHPLVNGTVSLSDGAVKFKPLATPVTNMNATVVFNGDTMTVSDFSGKMGEGSYIGQGTLKLDGVTPSTYDFSLTADKLDIQSDFFKGPLSGSLRINNAEAFGKTLPKISGQIDLDNCTISVPTIPDSNGELPDVLLDVDVNVGDKVHAYSSYLYDMYLVGKVHFGGTTHHPKTSGSVSVKRGGTVSYLKTEFNVREGMAYFNQVDSFLPSITFTADTRLTQAKVFLSITGPLDNMTFKLRSTPEMSQTEIIRLLTLRNAYKAGDANLDAGDLLIVGLQMSFLSEVEDVMRNMLWLDRFTIARGSGSAFDTHDEESNKDIDVYHVEMGKYITDKIMLKYTQQIGGDDTHRFGVQYDMNDRFGLSLEKEAQKFIVGLEARIHF